MGRLVLNEISSFSTGNISRSGIINDCCWRSKVRAGGYCVTVIVIIVITIAVVIVGIQILVKRFWVEKILKIVYTTGSGIRIVVISIVISITTMACAIVVIGIISRIIIIISIIVIGSSSSSSS